MWFIRLSLTSIVLAGGFFAYVWISAWNEVDFVYAGVFALLIAFFHTTSR